MIFQDFLLRKNIKQSPNNFSLIPSISHI
jgi:hypothetical protein